jgi:hypothetical protein
MTLGDRLVRTDEDGFADIDDVPVGTYAVRVSHKRFAPGELKKQVVVEGQQTDCGRIALTAAGSIRGKVMLADGSPARMAFVQRRLAGSEEWDPPEVAAGGQFRLGGLQAGSYEVRAQTMGLGEPAYSPIQRVDVKTGETANVDLTLPRQN